MAKSLSSALRLTTEIEMVPENALLAGKTIGRVYKTVTVGIGSNPSSRMICDALISGILSAGADVNYAGVAPAPAVALASGDSDCFIIVGEPDKYGTMSRINIYNPDGSRFNDEQIRHLVRISGEPFNLPDYRSVGKIRNCNSIIDNYNRTIAAGYKNVDCPVILDCGCGPTALCAPKILASVGADVISVNSQLDGDYYPRSPGVGKGDIIVLSEMVVDHIGSIGIALNGDGTRLALIDEGGLFVHDDEILALMLLYLKPAKLAVPLDSSSLIDDAFWGRIGKNIKTPAEVPESREIIRTESSTEAMVAAMKESNADLGSMNDGTFVFPKTTLCPDAINAAVLLSKISGDNSVRDLIRSFPRYIVLNDEIHYSGNYEMFSKRISDRLRELDLGELIHADGWRVDMEHGWFMIGRKSGEPDYVEITAESKDKAYTVTMLELAKSIVYDCV